ncbi:MAG: hypothetical protein ABS58_08235 [Mesorhizobium sp. SCN 65-20]|nr:MAG: hypothetical protein ABS58_08235 [Mesorhizobium sp. SCN 65-20]
MRAGLATAAFVRCVATTAGPIVAVTAMADQGIAGAHVVIAPVVAFDTHDPPLPQAAVIPDLLAPCRREVSCKAAL